MENVNKPDREWKRMVIRHLKLVKIGCFPHTERGKEALEIHAEQLKKAYGK